MSESNASPSPSPSPSAAPSVAKPEGRRAKPSRPAVAPPRALAPLAFLFALLALGLAGWASWQWWQGGSVRQAAAESTAALEKNVASLQQQLAARRDQDAAEQARLRRQWRADADDLQQEWSGLNQRTLRLEGAVNQLSRDRLGGAREAVLLDQAELLLRLGQQRYELFHDGAGALQAYTQADQRLAAATDPALSGVRQALKAERDALAATHPASREQALIELAALRAQIASLPLRTPAQPAVPSTSGWWARTVHALASVVRVQRTDTAAANVISAALARQLTALDLARAEAAQLAWNDAAAHRALQQALADLDAWFEAGNPEVGALRARIEKLESAPVTTKVSLGAALRQLQDQRAVESVGHDPAPASAASTSAGRGART